MLSLLVRYKHTQSSAKLVFSGKTSLHRSHISPQIRCRRVACRCQVFHSCSRCALSSGDNDISTAPAPDVAVAVAVSSPFNLSRQACNSTRSPSRRSISSRNSEILGLDSSAERQARTFFSSAFSAESWDERSSVSDFIRVMVSGLVESDFCGVW
jgi:hypothetical protein